MVTVFVLSGYFLKQPFFGRTELIRMSPEVYHTKEECIKDLQYSNNIYKDYTSSLECELKEINE